MGAQEYLGVGLYSVPEAARILHVRAGTLRRWVRGYPFSPERRGRPVLQRAHSELAEQGILTFVDLMELYLVRQFRQFHISMQTIRKTAEWAEKQYETTHPFVLKRFRTDGWRLFAECELPCDDPCGPVRVYQGMPDGQLALDQVVESFFKDLGYEGDIVSRYWPMGKSRPVVLDPAWSFGQPIDPETGVPTRVLYGPYQAGDTIEDIAHSFRVSADAVRAAVEYEELLAQFA